MTTSKSVKVLGGAGYQSITRANLIALAEADGLIPGSFYQTEDYMICVAMTARFLQPIGPWFVDGRQYSVGANTSSTELSYTTLPPLANNAVVTFNHEWEMDAVANTKRAQIYLDGTLGGGTGGAQLLYNRLVNAGTEKTINIYNHMQNMNDNTQQVCTTQTDSAMFGSLTNSPLSLTLNTNTSKLVRAMGLTAKTGSNVSFTATRTGAVANVTAASHGLATGDYIGVSGATPSGYNIDPVQITVTGASTFTYPLASDPGADATGSPVYQKYSKMKLNSFRVSIFQGI